MAAPTFVAYTSAADAAASTPETVTLALPSGAAVGDLLIAVLTMQPATATSSHPTVSSGTWSAPDAAWNGTGRYGSVLTKAVESSDSSFTFTYPSALGSQRQNALLIAVRNTSGVGQHTGWHRTGTGLTLGSTGLTTVPGESLILYFQYNVTAVSSTALLGTDPPTGWTKLGPAAQSTNGSIASDWLFGFYQTSTPGGTVSPPSSSLAGPAMADWKHSMLSLSPVVVTPGRLDATINVNGG